MLENRRKNILWKLSKPNPNLTGITFKAEILFKPSLIWRPKWRKFFAKLSIFCDTCIKWNLSKPNLLMTYFFVCNRQVVGLFIQVLTLDKKLRKEYIVVFFSAHLCTKFWQPQTIFENISSCLKTFSTVQSFIAGLNPCKAAKCEHMCLLSHVHDGYTCGCDVGYRLNSNGINCSI
jgi:hypothetical protein